MCNYIYFAIAYMHKIFDTICAVQLLIIATNVKYVWRLIYILVIKNIVFRPQDGVKKMNQENLIQKEKSFRGKVAIFHVMKEKMDLTNFLTRFEK